MSDFSACHLCLPWHLSNSVVYTAPTEHEASHCHEVFHNHCYFLLSNLHHVIGNLMYSVGFGKGQIFSKGCLDPQCFIIGSIIVCVVIFCWKSRTGNSSGLLHVHHSTQLLCIPDTSISMYQLDQKNFTHLWHLNLYVSTQPKYSCASLTPQFLRIYLTKIFLCISDITISMYLLDKIFLRISDTWFLLIYLTKIFLCISDITISYVSPRPKYSWASLTLPFLCIYLTKIFLRIPDTSISTYLLHQNILAHPWHKFFYESCGTLYLRRIRYGWGRLLYFIHPNSLLH